MSGLALLLATLGVLSMTTTVADAQPRTRGRVIIETHHTDLAGNIRLSTDEAGTPTAPVIDDTPFGEIIGASCNGGGDPTLSPKFQGKLRDPKTCLDDFGARDYYMVTGRFQSVDPVLPVETALRDPQQWNRYAYARNNPLIYTDPDGRVVWWIAAAAGGAAWGGAAQVAENLVTGRDWHDGVARAAGIGAATSVVGAGIFRGAATVYASASTLVSRLAVRQGYVKEVSVLAEKAKTLLASGASTESVARELHAMRRALGVKYKDLTDAEMLARIRSRNLEKYGDELGPTIEWLRSKGKTWEQIIESASRPDGKDLL